MTLKELLEKRAQVVGEAQALADAAQKESRELTEDEAAKQDALLAEADTLSASIATAEANQARADKLAAHSAAAAAPRPRASQAVSTTSNTTASIDLGDKPVTSGLRQRTKDDPKAGFESYDDYCAMVASCTKSGGISGVWASRPDVMAAASGQNVFSGADGGFTVPQEFSNELYARATTGSTLRAALFGRMQKKRLGGNSLTITAQIDHDKSSTTYRNAGVIPYLVAEAAQITSSKMQVRTVELKLHKMGALSYATSEELEDGSIDGRVLLQKHADAMGDEWLEYALWGTGTGQPMGMLNAPAVISTAKVSAQAADTVELDNVLDMEDDLWTHSEGTSLWIANRETRKYLRTLNQAVGTGGSVVNLFERGRAGESADMLDGIELYFSDHASALGDAGDVALVDPTTYVWATKRGSEINTDSSIHIRFDYDETAFRTTWRADGQPLWESSLRPRKGATAKRVSPYIKLAARA